MGTHRNQVRVADGHGGGSLGAGAGALSVGHQHDYTGIRQSGTSKEWRESVGALAQNNSRLVLAISCGFAVPLLRLCNEPSGGIHFVAPSSTGKTTALDTAASVWGPPEEYARSWLTTSNALEAMAFLHNDGLLVLDEIPQVDQRVVGNCAYLLANDRGKGRATKTGGGRPISRWRLLFLSAGEKSLESHMAQARQKPTAGQEVRLAEVQADAGATIEVDGKLRSAGWGIVEDLHGCQSSAELITKLRENCRKYYGVVGPEFVELLTKELMHSGIEAAQVTLAMQVEELVIKFAPRNADSQVTRVARRFALIAIAGEFATTFGVTGWAKGEATKQVAICFRSWLEHFGERGWERQSLMTQVRQFFEVHSDSRFEAKEGDVDRYPVSNRAGFYEDFDDGRHYYVMPEVFKQEVCQGFTAKWAMLNCIRNVPLSLH